MTGFEPRISVLGATALPTAQQSLPNYDSRVVVTRKLPIL